VQGDQAGYYPTGTIRPLFVGLDSGLNVYKKPISSLFEQQLIRWHQRFPTPLSKAGNFQQLSLPLHHYNMPSKQEGNPVSQRPPDRTRQEPWSPSRTAPEMESFNNSERNASELLGGFEYDWNDLNLIEV
jgi:hypothetical protein